MDEVRSIQSSCLLKASSLPTIALGTKVLTHELMEDTRDAPSMTMEERFDAKRWRERILNNDNNLYNLYRYEI